MVLAACGAALRCEEVCCSGVCEEVCCDDCHQDICNNMLVSSSGTQSKGFLCMKQFLIAETEVRTLVYYIKYYGFQDILKQLILVLKVLPVFHADCYSFFNS